MQNQAKYHTLARRSIKPLELELCPGHRLRFKDTPLEASTTPTKASKHVKSSINKQPPTPDDINNSSSSSITAIVQRIGQAACHSVSLAGAMLFPTQSLAFIQANEPTLSSSSCIPALYSSLCDDPNSVLFVMDDQALTEQTIPNATEFLRAFLPTAQAQSQEENLITTTTYQSNPIRLLAWKIELPPRIILYTGSPLDAQDPRPPHTLQKLLINERSKRQPVSMIHQVASGGATSTQDISSHIRLSLMRYAGTTLAPYQEDSGHTSHTLEEAIAAFVQPTASNHTTIPLNTSLAWNKSHIDPRYSETQTGANGARFRDWVCVYASDKSVEKCRLEGHLLEIPAAYETQLVWMGKHPVYVRSSIAVRPHLLVLPDVATPTASATTIFSEFSRSVRTRMLQDLRLLPVRLFPADTVERQNVTVYTDSDARQVLIVYAPTLACDHHPAPEPALEFISFQLQK